MFIISFLIHSKKAVFQVFAQVWGGWESNLNILKISRQKLRAINKHAKSPETSKPTITLPAKKAPNNKPTQNKTNDNIGTQK